MDLFTESKDSRHLEIRLDSPVAVFHGDQYEAAPARVTGTLVFENVEPINIKAIRIRLVGEWRVTWATKNHHKRASKGKPTRLVGDKGSVIDEEQQIFPPMGTSTKSQKLAPGKYEWRFAFSLDPKLPESIEGLSGNFVSYNLMAEVEKRMGKDLRATKPFKVVRTLGRDLSETVPLPYENEETWTDKIRYHIYIPSRYYYFGSSVPVQFTLFPLSKGIRIGKVKMEILERIELETGSMGDGIHTTTLRDRIVAEIEDSVTERHQRQLREESTGIRDDSYHFNMVLPLKKSLKDCRQSVVSDHIRIQHNMKICINIYNPDGHISQLCLRNHISLFISPQAQFDNLNLTSADDLQAIGTTYLHQEPENDAPPTYGTHVQDQIYVGDVDYNPRRNSFIPSGVQTPNHFLSRNHSVENFDTIHHNDFQLPNLEWDRSSSRASSVVDNFHSPVINPELSNGSSRRPSLGPMVTAPSSPDEWERISPESSNSRYSFLQSMPGAFQPQTPPTSPPTDKANRKSIFFGIGQLTRRFRKGNLSNFENRLSIFYQNPFNIGKDIKTFDATTNRESIYFDALTHRESPHANRHSVYNGRHSTYFSTTAIEQPIVTEPPRPMTSTANRPTSRIQRGSRLSGLNTGHDGVRSPYRNTLLGAISAPSLLQPPSRAPPPPPMAFDFGFDTPIQTPTEQSAGPRVSLIHMNSAPSALPTYDQVYEPWDGSGSPPMPLRPPPPIVI